MAIDYNHYLALEPFFAVIETAVRGDVDGGRYFDLLADDIEMIFMFAPPGSPQGIKGRQAIIDSFAGYGDILFLDAGQLNNVYKTDHEGVIIVQYSCQGRGVLTGKPYNQNYLSILTIANRKIVKWVDYWDPLVSIEAIGGTSALNEAMHTAV